MTITTFVWLLMAQARAAPAKVERVSIVEQGILVSEIDTMATTAKASDGQEISIERPKSRAPVGSSMRPSTEIPGRVGTSFGYRFKVHGKPRRAQVKLGLVIHYPPPGRRDAKTGKLSLESVITLPFGLGQEAYHIVEFGEASDIILGDWVLEVRKGKRSLARASFTVSLPRPPQPVRLTPSGP